MDIKTTRTPNGGVTITLTEGKVSTTVEGRYADRSQLLSGAIITIFNLLAACGQRLH